MDREERLMDLNVALAKLDECVRGEELEELAAELEDAIFLLECAEDEEEVEGALEEIDALADALSALAGDDAGLTAIADEIKFSATA